MSNEYKKLIMKLKGYDIKLKEYDEVLKQYEQLKNHQSLRNKVSYGYKRTKKDHFVCAQTPQKKPQNTLKKNN